MGYDNTNSGAIFENDRKTKDSHPDRTGSINVEGVEYFIDGWLKKTKEGKKYLSLSVKRKDKQPGPQSERPSAPAGRPQRPPLPERRPVAPPTTQRPPASRQANPAPDPDNEPQFGQDAPDADSNF